MATPTQDEIYKKIDEKVRIGALRADDAELLKRIFDTGPASQSDHGADGDRGTDSLNRLIAAGYVVRKGGGFFLGGAPTYELVLSSLE